LRLKLAPLPRQTALLFNQVRLVHRLADSVLLLASETAGECGLSVACVLGALTLALGRLAGSTARDNGAHLDGALAAMVRQLRRVAMAEFGRASHSIH